jgi:hypothetical protein
MMPVDFALQQVPASEVPANGQWQFGQLVCIGATGMQASVPRWRAPKK